ncbi:MAG: hypothetical protein SGILL_007593 [Bacillariaceae sp.]
MRHRPVTPPPQEEVRKTKRQFEISNPQERWDVQQEQAPPLIRRKRQFEISSAVPVDTAVKNGELTKLTVREAKAHLLGALCNGQKSITFKRNGESIKIVFNGTFKHCKDAPFLISIKVGNEWFFYMPIGLEADNMLFNDAVNMLVAQPALADQPGFHLVIIARLEKEYKGSPSLKERLNVFCQPGALLMMYSQYQSFANKSEFNTLKLDMEALQDNVLQLRADHNALAARVDSNHTHVVARLLALEKDMKSKASIVDIQQTALSVLDTPAGEQKLDSRIAQRFGSHEERVQAAVSKMRSEVEGNCALKLFFFHSECTSMNSALRGAQQESEWSEQLKWYVERMDYALFEKLKPSSASRKTCFRGMNIATMSPEGQRYWLNLSIGQHISDKAYWCTSETKKVSKGFAFGNRDPSNAIPIIFRITHTSGRSIKKYVSDRFTWEKEVLFPRNTMFRVDRIDIVYETSESGHTRPCRVIELSQVGEPMRYVN